MGPDKKNAGSGESARISNALGVAHRNAASGELQTSDGCSR